MTSCDYCGTGILFGANKDGDLRFCSPDCATKADWVRAALALPRDEADHCVRETHQSPCPRCGGPGPLDVYTSQWVYSALAWTSWGSRPEICCQSCGRTKYLKSGVFSLLLGWWGFPFGFVITPLQVCRNLGGLLGIGAPDPGSPSPALDRMVRLRLTARK